MSIYKIHFDVIIVKYLVTTKTRNVDMLYAATVLKLNIVEHMAYVKNRPNVSTAQVITLQSK